MKVTHRALKLSVKKKLKGKVSEEDIDKTLDSLWKKEGIGNIMRYNKGNFSIFGFLKFIKF